ncbi:MAG: oligoendopeptidase F, partial [Spirochaetales bacterium]|nr:oligoendopeptidase F [Spirochaetales bacterium]
MNIPERSEIPISDTWDLTRLFSSEEEWEKSLLRLIEGVPKMETFKGTLGTSVEHLHSFLTEMNELEQIAERLGNYAQLRTSENTADSKNIDRSGRYLSAATKLSTAISYFEPELMAIPEKQMDTYLADPLLADYRIALQKILRFKPHVLSEREERLLSMQAESNVTASKTFSALNDADMDFGMIETPDGKKPLSQSSFSSFLISRDRSIRETAYHQFYGVYEKHKNTLASLYNGSVQLDVYKAKIRNYPNVRVKALFGDKVPESVYDNLIETVRGSLPSLHRYYRFRKKILKLDTLRHYDVYVPLVSEVKTHYSFT